jgi:hypothetical protein
VAGQSVEAKIQTAVNGRVDQLDDILRASLGESDAFFRVLALEGNGTNASQALLSKTVAEVIASARLETMTAFAHSTDTNFVWKILTLRTNINDIQTPLGQLASGQPFSLIDTNVFWNRFSSGTNGSVLGTFRSQGETEPTSRSNDTNHFLTTVNFDFSSKDIETYRNLFWKFPLPDFDCAVLAKLYQSSVPRRDEYTFYYEILSAPGNVKTQEMVCYIVGMESGNGWDIIQRDECLRWLRIQLLK